MPAENIFAQFIRPLKSADDWQAERDTRMLRREQLAGVQRQNALADLMAQQQRGEMARTAQVRGDIRNVFSAGPDGVGDRLRGLGHQEAIDLADKLDKSALERRRAEADAGKTSAETLAKHLEAMSFLAKGVLANPTPQNAALAVDAFERLTGRQMPEERQRLATLTTPEAVRQWAAGHSLKADELQPKLKFINTGKMTVPVDENTLTNPNPQALPMTTTPGEDLSAQTSRSNNAATVGATIRGQNLTDARAREANSLTREANANVYDAERGVLVNKGTGLARPAATMDGKPLAAKMPESTKKEIASIDAQLSVLDGAIRDVKASPDAFTFKRGLATMAGPLTESAVGRLDSPAQRDARSYVFNVVSKVINERAGAAQSAQELARLRSFLPAETDNAQQITDKLESFKGYLSDLGNGYQGGRYQTQQPKAAPPASGAFSDAEKERRYQEWKQKQGK